MASNYSSWTPLDDFVYLPIQKLLRFRGTSLYTYKGEKTTWSLRNVVVTGSRYKYYAMVSKELISWRRLVALVGKKLTLCMWRHVYMPTLCNLCALWPRTIDRCVNACHPAVLRFECNHMISNSSYGFGQNLHCYGRPGSLPGDMEHVQSWRVCGKCHTPGGRLAVQNW